MRRWQSTKGCISPGRVARLYLTDNGDKFLLHFEPPLLAWTYHLQKWAPARPAVEGIFHALAAVFLRGERSFDEMEEVVFPHTPYNMGVIRCTRIHVCKSDNGEWTVYADHGQGI